MISAQARRLITRRVEIEDHRVLGNVSVESNGQVERTAKAAADGMVARRCAEQFTSLVHINMTISEREWKEPNHWFMTKHEARPNMQRVRYNPDLCTQKLDEVALHEKAHIVRAYYQLKPGQAITGTFLKWIGRRDSHRYWECRSTA